MTALELCEEVLHEATTDGYSIRIQNGAKLARALKLAILTLQGYKVNGDSVETLPKAPIEL